MSDLFQKAISILDKAAKYAQIDAEALERLKHPKAAMEVSIPVRMDDGSLKVFTGYRVHHSVDRGGYAIHGSFDVPSYNASHGCVRILPEDAQWLSQNILSYGATVIIEPYN